MSDQLRDVIEQMKQELSDNIFVQFIESFEGNDFGTNENQDYFKKLYLDVLQLYKSSEEIENED